MSILIFFLATLAFAALTWRYAVAKGRSQGFFRFAAFEGMAAIVLVDYGAWFVDIGSPTQIVSFAALAVSIYLALAGFLTLKRLGRPQGHFEYTTELVTGGVFRFIRHPMYASLLFFAVGADLKQPLSPPVVAIFVITVAAIFLTAKAEEKDLVAAFGPRYLDYMKKTARFIPFVL
jgi:protein-S-isoprenylcysteine O-methyltransferase Ste14